MIKQILVLLGFMLFQTTIAQNKKLSGLIISENIAIQNADIVNINLKQSTKTNNEGKFSILANVGDSLLVYSKNYEITTVVINSEDFTTANFKITLNLKTQELNEVIINTKPKSTFDIQKIIDNKYVDDLQTSPKNRLIYDGSIENGIDFARIGREVVKLVRKNKKKKTNTPSFQNFALKTCDKYFFKEQLELNIEEIEEFLDYCAEDSNSKIIIEKNNVFDLMDFLNQKIVHFKYEINLQRTQRKVP